MDPAELGRLASEAIKTFSENPIPFIATMFGIAGLGFAIKSALPSRWRTIRSDGNVEGDKWALQERTLPVRPVQRRHVVLDNNGRVIGQVGPNYVPKVPENRYTPRIK